MKLHKFLNLHLFDGGAAAGGGTGVGSGASDGGEGAGSTYATQGKETRNSLSGVRYGKQTAEAGGEITQKEPEASATTNTQDQRKAEFERMIKGDFKDLFDERVKQNIDARFKQVKSLEAKARRAESFEPVLEMIANKYGVDVQDAEKLVKAIEEDDSYYEDEAMQKGLTVAQLKEIKRIERENAEFRRAAEERKKQENADRIYSRWQQEAEACKQMYPGFDLQSECSSSETGERFLGLLKAGVDVGTAYEVIHRDEIIGGAMHYTAQKVQQKVVNDIRTRGMRPSENGASGTAAATITKADPRSFTRKDRDEISRRVMRGERIEL